MRARVVTPESFDEAAEAVVASAPHGLIARGAGRSYGDAAQLSGGVVLDMTRLDRIVEVDAERLLVRAQAGATIDRMMAALCDHGLTLPVVPGTRHVTLAGALASDVHGKNHHRDGGFSRHVSSITIYTPAGGIVEIDADRDAELFYATLGGMGLTGVVLEATLAVVPAAAQSVDEDVERTGDLDETLALVTADAGHRYCVAWLDMLATGRSYGRAIVSRANLSDGSRAGRRAVTDGASYVAPARLRVPSHVPNGVLAPSAVRAFNAARWRAAPRRRVRCAPFPNFLFPLDFVACWNRLYGSAGLLQYQAVIPSGCERELTALFEMLRGAPVYLAVFKRFGPAFGGPLSFPLAGWTLAVDLPAAEGVTGLLDELDELVAGAGGRVYLSKDARLRREHLAAMYPRLGEFSRVRQKVDPDGILRSDLGARLGLSEPVVA
ncbi:MAG TPA: FAD-binding oxidoreductase [Solirubrobacteraceae bacterium]|nr:FAD-binding oxidoreductase [Solirubrobacteraceae bacterium]